MKTVKEIAEITGMSRRAIRYYDEVGLLKPTELSESGYRLYDDKALEILQQILFFKELDVPLKEIKLILNNPNFDRIRLLESHKKLLIMKRDRLNGLIAMIDETIKEPDKMSFKEFEFAEIEKTIDENYEKLKESEHYQATLDAIKDEYGSYEEFVAFIKESLRKNSGMIVAMYGSLENYNEVLKRAIPRADKVSNCQERQEELSKQLSKLVGCEPVDSPKVQELIAELDKVMFEISGTDFAGFARAVEWAQNQPSSDDDKKKYEEQKKQARETIDNIYGQGYYDFKNDAVNYYVEHNLEG